MNVVPEIAVRFLQGLTAAGGLGRFSVTLFASYAMQVALPEQCDANLLTELFGLLGAHSGNEHVVAGVYLFLSHVHDLFGSDIRLLVVRFAYLLADGWPLLDYCAAAGVGNFGPCSATSAAVSLWRRWVVTPSGGRSSGCSGQTTCCARTPWRWRSRRWLACSCMS